MRPLAGRAGGAVQSLETRARHGASELEERVGGAAQAHVVMLLAGVLALDAADQGAIGAIAPQLEGSLHISNIQLGLLLTVTAFVGAFATVPMGSLVDRTRRVRLLALLILTWSVGEGLSGLAVSYGMLLVLRVFLGITTAVAAPAVASLTGDLFPAGRRGRAYGFIVTGEVLGAGVGVLAAGLLSGWFGWRVGIAVLAVPGFGLSFALLRHLPEPARGCHACLAESLGAQMGQDLAASDGGAGRLALVRAIEGKGLHADERNIVEVGPDAWTFKEAVLYVLRVKTNIVLIIASSLGYFFYAGLNTFAVIFIRGNYDVSQPVTTILIVVVGAGSVAGILLGAHHSDNMIAKGRVNARLDGGVAGYLLAPLLLAPALLMRNLAAALPLIVVGAAAISAPNGTLDAARLDIVPAQLWGRAEGIRTLLRTLLEGAAPLVFGVVSDAFSSTGVGSGARTGDIAAGLHTQAASALQVGGLGDAFLVMLVCVAAGGAVLLLGRRTYPVDVISAAESQRRGSRAPIPEPNGSRPLASSEAANSGP